jgi:O-glycosyl hydrolase
MNKGSRRAALLGLGMAFLLSSCTTVPGSLPAPVEEDVPRQIFTLDVSKRYQTIRHFGASAAWWAQAVGTWPDAQVEKALDLLFDRRKGIGLDLIRYNIGGGKAEARLVDDWRSAESPIGLDGSLDWSRDAAAVHVVDRAVKRGASVILFCNSPPASMTVTGSPTGNTGACNLRPDKRADYAKFLADCVQSLRKGRRWPLVAVSPVNEPQWDWPPSTGQEGSHWSPEDAKDVIEALVDEFARRRISVPISAIDSAEWSVASNAPYLEAIWGDPRIRSALGHYAVHSYWSDLGERAELSAYIAEKYPGLELWQTEWTEMRGGRDAGMDSALILANTVHRDLVEGQVSSWQYWIAVSKYDFHDGLLYADPAAQTFLPTKRLWALGNWSRFLRPGARRIEAAGPADAGLAVSAFRNPDRSVVAVIINRGEETQSMIEPRPGRNYRHMEAWETSEARDLERVYQGRPCGLRLPSKSVTTFVFR